MRASFQEPWMHRFAQYLPNPSPILSAYLANSLCLPRTILTIALFIRTLPSNLAHSHSLTLSQQLQPHSPSLPPVLSHSLTLSLSLSPFPASQDFSRGGHPRRAALAGPGPQGNVDKEPWSTGKRALVLERPGQWKSRLDKTKHGIIYR